MGEPRKLQKGDVVRCVAEGPGLFVVLDVLRFSSDETPALVHLRDVVGPVRESACEFVRSAEGLAASLVAMADMIERFRPKPLPSRLTIPAPFVREDHVQAEAVTSGQLVFAVNAPTMAKLRQQLALRAELVKPSECYADCPRCTECDRRLTQTHIECCSRASVSVSLGTFPAGVDVRLVPALPDGLYTMPANMRPPKRGPF